MREKVPSTPAEKLVGKWNITAAGALGAVIPGDGSYLKFDACGEDECTGTDHMASNATTGSITYDLAADGRTITIQDTTADGGMYNGTWKILELGETKLKIAIDSGGILGTAVNELEKVQ